MPGRWWPAAWGGVLLLLLLPAVADTRQSHLSTFPTEAAGVLLWSLGRCSTGSFAESFVDTCGKIRFCAGQKEGFKESARARLTASALKRCVEAGPTFAHVKPSHIMQRSSSLKSPETFFKAVKDAGFDIVVVIRRQNHLARLVSSWEISKDYKRAARRVGNSGLKFAPLDAPETADTPFDQAMRRSHLFANVTKTIMYEDVALERGVAAARREQLRVVEYDFVNTTGRMCETVHDLVGRFQPHCKPAAAHSCSVQTTHHTARKSVAFEDRVGSRGFANLAEQLRGTVFAWMLDSSQLAWPHGTTNPVQRKYEQRSAGLALKRR